jgi:hypothetical protein
MKPVYAGTDRETSLSSDPGTDRPLIEVVDNKTKRYIPVAFSVCAGTRAGTEEKRGRLTERV